MAVQKETYLEIKKELDARKVTLVAVSKTKPVSDILALYELGHRDFGENYVQELTEKHTQLPPDIRWHFIGHLQSNKVRYIAPFVHLIHGVDSSRLLQEINKQAQKQNRTLSVLLQVHIAREETKFGLNETELQQVVAALDGQPLHQVQLRGLMGMASFTTDQKQIRAEFSYLKNLYDQYRGMQSRSLQFDTLSMGMSADYRLAIGEGTNLVRIGSLLFGSR
jgi:PLP dependent protein